MKTAVKCDNNEFLVISLKHVMGLTGLANPLGTQKPWEISHENGQKKHENGEFFVTNITHISGLKVSVNRP